MISNNLEIIIYNYFKNNGFPFLLYHGLHLAALQAAGAPPLHITPGMYVAQSQLYTAKTDVGVVSSWPYRYILDLIAGRCFYCRVLLLCHCSEIFILKQLLYFVRV